MRSTDERDGRWIGHEPSQPSTQPKVIGLFLTIVVCGAFASPFVGLAGAVSDSPVVVDSTTMGQPANETYIVQQGDELTLQSAAEQSIRGETQIEPGTTLSVQIRSSGENPFLKSGETSVSESGTFEIRFDMGNVPVGTPFEVIVSIDGKRLTTTRGRVVDCDGPCPTPTERDDAGTSDLPGDELAVGSHVEVVRGNTANIPVTLGDAQAATIVVGAEQVGYQVSGTIRDEDGDGRLLVQFVSERAGFEAPTLAVYDGGNSRAVQKLSETPLQSLLDAGEYPVRIYRGTNTEGEPADEGTLVVHEAPAIDDTESPTPTVTPAQTSTITTDGEGDNDGPLGSFAGGVGTVLLGGALLGAGLLIGRSQS